MKVRKYFSNRDEIEFVKDTQLSSISYIRKVFLLFIFLYALYGISDIVYFPDTWGSLHMIRFGVVIPILIATILLSFTKSYLKYSQHYIAFSFFTGGIGVAYMLILSPENIVYYGGLFMVYFSGYLLIKLRFYYATVAGWAIFAFHVLSHLFLNGEITNTFLFGTLFFIGANLIGMVGAYNIENMDRKRFLHERELERVRDELKQQFNDKVNQLEQLEQSIKENKELLAINKELDFLTKSLSESESRYRQLREQSKTFTWEVDKNGLYTFVDSVSETVLGYSPNELINKKYFYDLCPLEQQEEFKQVALNLSKNKERFYNLENSAITKNGDKVFLLTNGIPVLDDNGFLLGYRGSDTDITHKKQAEEALVHSYELMRYIIEHNRGSVAVHDTNLNYLYVSKRYLDEFGVTEKDIIGKHHYDVFPDLPQKWREVHQRALSGEIISAENDVYYRNDGSIEWTRWECRPWYNLDESIGGIIIYTEVITDYIMLLEDLKHKEENLKIAQRIARVGSFEYKLTNKTLKFSDEGLNIFGVKQSDFANSTDEITPFISTDEMNNVYDIYRKVETEKKVFGREINISRKDKQERVVDLNMGPLVDEDGNLIGITGTIQDITQRKKAEENLIYLNNHDQLTKLYNRRYFESELKRMDTISQLPLSIIVADINGLKLMNDSFGVSQGDKMILESAKIISSCCKETGIVARTGGDEFRILLPQTSSEGTMDLLKHIQNTCNQYNLMTSNDAKKISLSFGMGTKESEYEDFTQIIKNAEDYMNQRKLLEKTSSHSDIISSIQAAMLEKSNETKEHSERIAHLSKKVGEKLQLSQIELAQIELLATLHDIGKIGVPEHILMKPAKLNEDEWNEMKKHPEIGYRIAMSSPNLAPIAEYILYHHERWDGKGYPHNLKGTDIPLISRIISVVDAYDAMTEDRIYRKAMTNQEALDEIIRCSGTQFDPQIVEVFIKSIEFF